MKAGLGSNVVTFESRPTYDSSRARLSSKFMSNWNNGKKPMDYIKDAGYSGLVDMRSMMLFAQETADRVSVDTSPKMASISLRAALKRYARAKVVLKPDEVSVLRFAMDVLEFIKRKADFTMTTEESLN